MSEPTAPDGLHDELFGSSMSPFDDLPEDDDFGPVAPTTTMQHEEGGVDLDDQVELSTMFEGNDEPLRDLAGLPPLGEGLQDPPYTLAADDTLDALMASLEQPSQKLSDPVPVAPGQLSYVPSKPAPVAMTPPPAPPAAQAWPAPEAAAHAPPPRLPQPDFYEPPAAAPVPQVPTPPPSTGYARALNVGDDTLPPSMDELARAIASGEGVSPMPAPVEPTLPSEDDLYDDDYDFMGDGDEYLPPDDVPAEPEPEPETSPRLTAETVATLPGVRVSSTSRTRTVSREVQRALGRGHSNLVYMGLIGVAVVSLAGLGWWAMQSGSDKAGAPLVTDVQQTEPVMKLNDGPGPDPVFVDLHDAPIQVTPDTPDLVAEPVARLEPTSSPALVATPVEPPQADDPVPPPADPVPPPDITAAIASDAPMILGLQKENRKLREENERLNNTVIEFQDGIEAAEKAAKEALARTEEFKSRGVALAEAQARIQSMESELTAMKGELAKAKTVVKKAGEVAQERTRPSKSEPPARRGGQLKSDVAYQAGRYEVIAMSSDRFVATREGANHLVHVGDTWAGAKVLAIDPGSRSIRTDHGTLNLDAMR